jgi:rSAM/selenodomain-associated transferase 1
MGLFTTNTNSHDTGDETFFFHSSNKALIIFTRNPELGKVKTRLAAKTGDEIALKIYKFLIDHTVEITKGLKVDKYVYYSDQVHDNDQWDDTIFRKRTQHGEDLGVRMQLAFHDLFREGYEHIIIVGSDIYDLSTEDINMAFDSLDSHDFVIGPAEDGGYYLLGMKQLKSELFMHKDWGHNTVFNDSLKDLIDEKVKVLPMRNDVDYYEDICDVEAFQPFLNEIKSR